MMNQIVLIGRIAQDLEIKEQEEKKGTILTLAVPRSFKNMNGEYETDFIPCRLWGSIAENTCEYCKQGDLVGIKGRIQTTPMASGSVIEVIVEKVTFLSNRKPEEE